jgi:hypothetical protein
MCEHGHVKKYRHVLEASQSQLSTHSPHSQLHLGIHMTTLAFAWNPGIQQMRHEVVHKQHHSAPLPATRLDLATALDRRPSRTPNKPLEPPLQSGHSITRNQVSATINSKKTPTNQQTQKPPATMCNFIPYRFPNCHCTTITTGALTLCVRSTRTGESCANPKQEVLQKRSGTCGLCKKVQVQAGAEKAKNGLKEAATAAKGNESRIDAADEAAVVAEETKEPEIARPTSRGRGRGRGRAKGTGRGRGRAGSTSRAAALPRR